jgi:glucokinase
VTNAKPKSDLVCAVDLGGTNLRAAVIDCEGEIHQRARRSTPRDASAADIVQAIEEAVGACENKSARRGTDIAAVSVVVPGTSQVGTGVVTQAPNIPCLNGYALAPALEEGLRRPVFVENDANAAAVGEMWQGAARGCQTIICVTLGTGVGGGIILDGKLWRGIDGSAGELGHISVEPFGGIHCRCGNVGCLEVYASATAIVRMAGEALASGQKSSLQADHLTAERIYRAGVDGDELARQVFGRMGTYLGVGLAGFINIFNPEVIVIGGGVAAGWELFEKFVRQEAARRAFSIPAKRANIVRAACGDDAGLLGAARLAFLQNR